MSPAQRLVRGFLFGVILGSAFLMLMRAAKADTFEADAGRTVYITGVVDSGILHHANRLEELSRISKEDISIVINSPGGSVFAGMQFVGAMRLAQERGITIRCLVPMAAASMAFIIFNECDERYSLQQALFLWHGVRVGLMGTYTVQDMHVILRSLVRFTQDFDEVLMRELKLDKKEFYYHYHNNSWIPARKLRNLSPDYMTIVDDVKGVNVKLFSMGR